MLLHQLSHSLLQRVLWEEFSDLYTYNIDGCEKRLTFERRIIEKGGVRKKITHLADTYKFSTLTSWTPLKYYCAMTCWYLQPPPLSPIGGFCIFPSSSYLLTVLFSEISDIMCFFTKLVNFLARTPGKFIHILTIKNCQSWTVLAEFFLVVLLSEILKVEKSENIIRS